MRKHVKLVTTFTLTIPLLFGCTANYDNEARNMDNNVQNARYNTTDNNRAQDIGTNRRTNQQTREVAEEAADRVADLEEVRQANVVVTNRNAYVAVILDDQPKGEMTRAVENKISNAVKQTDRNIRNVFVSTNPDFVDRMADYSNKLQRGEPIEGLFEEFNEMVLRVFPNAR
ncbi:MAG TPA: YhcN/YlaJ family sporulation lipoprotein [Anoxybacillus sp.]|jgi:spore cortex protein|nr:YhcN/YlaJ family sporulation lipoprotein [Anoxybacillus sp.]